MSEAVLAAPVREAYRLFNDSNSGFNAIEAETVPTTYHYSQTKLFNIIQWPIQKLFVADLLCGSDILYTAGSIINWRGAIGDYLLTWKWRREANVANGGMEGSRLASTVW